MHRIRVEELHFPQTDKPKFHFHFYKLKTCDENCDICRSKIPYIQFYEWQNSRSIINYNVFDFETADKITDKILDKNDTINVTKMQDTIENCEFWRIPKRTFIGFDNENKIILR